MSSPWSSGPSSTGVARNLSSDTSSIPITGYGDIHALSNGEMVFFKIYMSFYMIFTVFFICIIVEALKTERKQRLRRVTPDTKGPSRQKEFMAYAISMSHLRSRELALEQERECSSSSKRSCHQQVEPRGVFIERPTFSIEGLHEIKKEMRYESKEPSRSEYEDIFENVGTNVPSLQGIEVPVDLSGADNSTSQESQCTLQSGKVSEAAPTQDELVEPEEVNTTAGASRENILEQVEENLTQSENDQFNSGISHLEPFEEDPKDRPMQVGGMLRLKNLILEVNPKVPDSLNLFVDKANSTLTYLAHLGLEKRKMIFWEDLCRKIERYIQRLQSFDIVRKQLSYSYMEGQVKQCQSGAEEAYRLVTETMKAIQFYSEKQKKLTIENEVYTAKMKELWAEIDFLMTKIATGLKEQNFTEKTLQKEQKTHQIRQQAVNTADKLLKRAKENLQVVDAERAAIAPVLNELYRLQVSVGLIEHF